MSGDALAEIKLTVANFVWMLSGVLAIGTVIWTAASFMSEIKASAMDHGRDIAALRSDLADGVARGRLERERVDATSAQRHQLQQAEIDRLRVENATFGQFVAATGERLKAMEELLREIKDRVNRPTVADASPVVPLRRPIDRIAPQPWSLPLNPR